MNTSGNGRIHKSVKRAPGVPTYVLFQEDSVSPNILFSIVANHIVENMGRMITCLSESNLGQPLPQPVFLIFFNFIQCLFSCVADHMIENTCRLVICLYDVYGALDCSFVTGVSKHYY